MMLKISERNVDDVTILDMHGLLIDPGEKTFRTAVADVLQEGKQKILLNLMEIRYINSPGIGELVSTYTRARNLGAELKLFGLTKKALDLLQITKLFTVFEVFDNEAVAVRSFSRSGTPLGPPSLRCLCPLCGYVSNPALSDDKPWQPQTCTYCYARFTVASSGKSVKDIALISLQITSYWGENIEIVSGWPTTISVVGRLDLFSSSALKKAWDVIPAPRIVLVDLSRATEMDEPGRDALVTLLASRDDQGKAVISVEGAPENVGALLRLGTTVYSSKAEALNALGNLPAATSIPVRLWNPRRASPEMTQ